MGFLKIMVHGFCGVLLKIPPIHLEGFLDF
jgi:hypothetical protein